MELPGVELSAAQRTNPLMVIVADAGYPESVLSPEQFKLFREATLHALDREPVSNWPRFETSFCRGGVFIFVASNREDKAWLNKTGPAVVLRRLEGLNPSLKTASWCIVRHERPQEANETRGLQHLLVVQVTKCQARALAGLNDRSFYHLGQIAFNVIGREQEEPGMETKRPE